MGNAKSKERLICNNLLKFFQNYKCNISKALSKRIDSFSEDDVNTIIPRMQEIIDDGSDHIKDLEEKIKNQGKGQNIITIVYQNDKTKTMVHILLVLII